MIFKNKLYNGIPINFAKGSIIENPGNSNSFLTLLNSEIMSNFRGHFLKHFPQPLHLPALLALFNIPPTYW